MNQAAQTCEHKLIQMAGQIADFFRIYPEKEAAAAIADHLRQFWTPAMRADLLAQAGDPEVVRDHLLSASLLLLQR